MIRHSGTAWLLATVATGALLAAAAPAQGAELDELKKQIEALTKKVQDLEAKQKAAPAPAAAAGGGSFPGSFKTPGTDTSIRIGGYAKGDVIYDVRASTGDSVTFGAIPLDGSVAAGQKGSTRLHARQSRLNVTTSTPTGLGEFRTFIEGDFFGSGGNEVFSNSTSFRLRHAYGQLGPVLAGQTWSNFMDLDSLPETIDFNGPTGQSFIRQAQVRYTADLGAGATFAVAIENPEGDVTSINSAGTGALTSSPTTGPAGGINAGNILDGFPDLTAHYKLKAPWGHFGVRGVLRQIRRDNDTPGTANGNDTEIGWGLGLGASYKVVGKDLAQFHFNFGEGIGRYLQEAGGRSALVRTNGDLDSLFAWGGILSYQHFWADNLRSVLAYGHTEIDNRTSGLSQSVQNTLDETFDSVHVNLIWSPVPKIDLGIEYIYGRRTVESGISGSGIGDSGDIHRFQFGALYRL